jgi:hypothetical protein
MHWRLLYGTRRRRLIALTCFTLAGSCYLRGLVGGWQSVPPEAMVGSWPLFALALVQARWVREARQGAEL